MTGQKRYFWLAVTADEYELPLAVEDTAAALARRLGVSEDTVRVMEYRGKNERYRRTKKGPIPGFGTRYKVRKVEVKQVEYADDWIDWDTPYLYTDEKEAEAKARQLRNQRKRLESGWIPVTERLPENSDYVLMSFENFSLPLVGRYVDDGKLGGAWYLGDCFDEDTCLANDLFVNAWMPLPKPYREDE